ncbi:hypothetical protein GobsT_41070 [Gemmata obscuriglobus]|uniref:abortive infection family protein n=1 Tax=Gemmata obscuriglobus TaxID=114 RepID=UPI0011CD170D|nr:abortive infection family protein [Gemmata obscuriglobus]QEG29312.1 hypothetical protein GobsT_41070 [Gemmata obscuriglobus]VTS08297.1 Uncharacterized protein OS=Klebsiella oxytoca KONIH1 GN=KONIH1_05790 PE=4 SV=1 [Gemmata obscuriglobus UQM 2246]
MGWSAQKQEVPIARYTYSLSERVRMRVLQFFKNHRNGWGEISYSFERLLGEVADLALQKYGSLKANFNQAYPAAQHFLACVDDEAIEFIEMCFRTNAVGTGDAACGAVAWINQMFEEEGVGYELTAPVWRDTGERATLYGRQLDTNVQRVEYPRLIKKGERTTHEIVVKPALEVLAGERFSVANGELLNAFEEVKNGDYAGAITSCGSAFESVLRTICDFKGWTFDPNAGSCSTYVEICRKHDLFPPHYTEIFKAVGMIRNKMGDAHGKGPKPSYIAGREYAEHMIGATCAHINLLISLAGC